MIAPFALGRLPRVAFGPGELANVPAHAAAYGTRALLVTGTSSLRAGPHWAPLCDGLRARGVAWREVSVRGEPSPAFVDDAVRAHAGEAIGVVVAIGGGSVLDAGKAIAGLLPGGGSAMDYLEEVGRGVPYAGPALPVIAVPTTAGTGSEATRNAVLSEVAPRGFKRSFRHEALVPAVAVLDPELLASCPRALIAADGMDALTQLLEAYCSPRSSLVIDALVERALVAVREGLLPWYEGRGDVAAARGHMAFAAFVSGVALAHAGLGAVHGLAAPLGGSFPVAHGVACGTLLAAATAVNVAALRARDAQGPGLAKLARAHALLAACAEEAPPHDAPERLVALFEDWTRRLELPRLGALGVGATDVAGVVAGCRAGSLKSNIVVLDERELAAILNARL